MRAERSSTVTVMNHILVRISIKSPSAPYQLEPTPEKSDTPYHFRGYYYISTITHHCAPLWSIVYRIFNSSTTYYLQLWLLPRVTRSLIQERKGTFPSSWVHDLRALIIALDISRNFYRIAVYIQPVSLSKFDSNNQTPFSPACIRTLSEFWWEGLIDHVIFRHIWDQVVYFQKTGLWSFLPLGQTGKGIGILVQAAVLPETEAFE